jgi:ethanolamine utilization protein EutN
VVSTIHADVFEGRKLLLCDYLDLDGEETGDYVIAVDVVDAGAGETVLILDEGNGARQIVDRRVAPIRAVVVGIVDAIELG